MSDPYTTILRDIASDPNQYALMVIASWCDKSADRIEELEAENERLNKEVCRKQERVDELEVRCQGLGDSRDRWQATTQAQDDLLNQQQGVISTYKEWHYNNRQRIAELAEELDELEAQHNKFLEEFWKTNADNERLTAAIRWALGETGDFPAVTGPPYYAWRTELRVRSGIGPPLDAVKEKG